MKTKYVIITLAHGRSPNKLCILSKNSKVQEPPSPQHEQEDAKHCLLIIILIQIIMTESRLVLIIAILKTHKSGQHTFCRN